MLEHLNLRLAFRQVNPTCRVHYNAAQALVLNRTRSDEQSLPIYLIFRVYFIREYVHTRTLWVVKAGDAVQAAGSGVLRR